MATLAGGFNLGRNPETSTQALSLVGTATGLTRLQLHGDARIDTIAARALHGLSVLKRIAMALSFRWVAIDLRGAPGNPIQHLMVNIGSLAKRAGLTTTQARQLLKSENGLERLSHLTQGLVSSLKKPPATAHAQPANSGILADLHRKVVSIAAPLLIKSKGVGLEAGVANKDNWCLVIKNEGRAISLYDVGANTQAHKILGDGSFGVVVTAKDLVSEENNGALKIAKESDDTSVQEEAAILNILNPGGQVPGLQLPPMRVTHLMRDGDLRPAYLAIRYDSDLGGTTTLTGADIKPAFYQLTKGLLHMHASGWFHGDIKPTNMLTKSSADHPRRFDIADLGGAEMLDKKIAPYRDYIGARGGVAWRTVLQAFIGVYTPEYTKQSDLTHLIQYLNEYLRTNDRVNDLFLGKIRLILQAKDAYALSQSLAEMVLGRYLDLSNLNGELSQVLAFLQSSTNNISLADAQKIVACMRQMMGIQAPTRFVWHNYETRIKAMRQLNQLMGI